MNRRGEAGCIQTQPAPRSGVMATNRKVDIIWRDKGAIHHKHLGWRKPATTADLAEWMEDYIELVNNGYMPVGFERAPLPHCARVIENGRVLAEWYLSPTRSAESLVTAEPLGPEGIPAVSPSAPCSECLAVPKSAAPCDSSIQADAAEIRRMSPDLIRAVLTTG